MKETRSDTRVALLQAFGLHVLLFALMFAGLQWTRSNMMEPAAGDPIEADLIDPSALSASMRSAMQRMPEALPRPVVEQPVVEQEPEPLPQPVAEDTPPPAPVPDPEPVEQEKVQRDAISPDVAKVPNEQEEKRKQPDQVDLDAQRRERLLAEIRKQREQAAKERTQAEMRAQQLADARAQQPVGSNPASPPPGNRGQDSNLGKQYAAALQEAILRQWTRPETVELGQRCRITIRQIPGGEVVNVDIAPSCPYDALGRRSVEAAILKASPLPYAGFEAVFSRNLDLNFIAEDR
ncbi:cell envelope integrity protein TolA [Thermomonas sp. HDW16]|uniref:cell envelope integrity protein TolA n=1 Tax=Thermomonas sp. HDW16 TaxID=2714945 RepID=UPI00140A68BC|nr:cell envelope integrity protein TolA [Thermomonas sp. HDW16]QIL21384.1 cell envelope integrity protein TolA [Thermomonas sp. HDW16]